MSCADVRIEQRPKLLMIGPTPPPHHGVAVAMQVLLDAPWHEHFTLTHLDIADRRGIDHVNQPDFYDIMLFLRHWARLVRLVVRERPHLVYVPISQSTIGFLRDSLLIWPAYMIGSRVVLHLHGGNFRSWYEARNSGVQAYVRIVLRRVARMVVLGESLRELFTGLIARERLAVVPNGVGWKESSPRARAAPGRRRYRVLYLGTLSQHKGVAVLIEAIALVERERQDVEFIFAGAWSNPRDRRHAESFIGAHGVQDAVSFVGIIDGEPKRRLFESADLFVFPGLQQEGQPLVVIEAMAAGLPVLFTNRGCLRDTVIGGEQGLEVRIGDQRDLADKILWMVSHPLDMQKMGANARERFVRLYTRERFVEDMQGVFANVVAEAPQSIKNATREKPMETTREYFDRIAVPFNRNYLQSYAFHERREVWSRLIKANLQRLGGGALCMDMGCGDGILGRIVAAQGHRVIGVDQSEEMLVLARRYAREEGVAAFAEYTHAKLPLQREFLERYGGSAGLILCSSVLEYIEEADQVLEQFRGLLRGNGRLIVSIPNGHSLYRLGERAFGRILASRDSYLRHQRQMFYPDSFKARIRDLGLRTVGEEYFSLPYLGRGSSLFGSYRSKRLATLYLLIAEKA